MSRFTALFRSKPFWVLVAVVLLSFLIWWRGAIVAFGDYRPLGTDRAQWIAIGVLCALYVLWLIARWWREKNINARLLNHLAKPTTTATPAAAEEGVEQVAELRK